MDEVSFFGYKPKTKYGRFLVAFSLFAFMLFILILDIVIITWSFFLGFIILCAFFLNVVKYREKHIVLRGEERDYFNFAFLVAILYIFVCVIFGVPLKEKWLVIFFFGSLPLYYLIKKSCKNFKVSLNGD